MSYRFSSLNCKRYSFDGLSSGQMDASEWVYAGEGGKHAVFEYVGANYDWQGKAIRFKKKPNCGVTTTIESDAAAFVGEIIVPLLSPYVDAPQYILLPFMFVKELLNMALSSKKVPDVRLESWDIADDPSGNNDPVPAVLLWNYKKLPGDVAVSCLSLEIKPKAGYLAVSPLVCPANRAKYNYSRFTILQDLTAQGRVKKGWQSDGEFFKSAYNPLDLYSGDLTRIRSSLEHLFSLPQNNLKVWFENHELVGLSEKHTDDRLVAKKAAMAIFHSEINDLESQLIPLLSEVLFQENILSTLLRLQKLDVMDADGIILIYHHLENLCDGDLESVNRMLGEKLVLSNSYVFGSTSEPGSLASPFNGPNCPTLNLLTDEIQQFAIRLCNHQMDEQGMDQAYESTVACVARLSKEVCVFLIQNWLFSLAMSDVSLFVTIRPATRSELPKRWNLDYERHTIIRPQTTFEPGLAVKSYVVDGERHLHGWFYSIKLIDCDNKPVSKLKSRAKKEAIIQFFQR